MERKLRSGAPGVRRKHCLAVVARECGFTSWERARRALEGEPGAPELGTLLYGRDAGALHHWFATHDEARAHVAALPEAPRSYLLAYKHHVFVADRAFVAKRCAPDPGEPERAAREIACLRHALQAAEISPPPGAPDRLSATGPAGSGQGHAVAVTFHPGRCRVLPGPGPDAPPRPQEHPSWPI
ncbi:MULTISPECIES: hypothetical protein [Sorangium]|uniref:hypothetical protein n=1 Tax=Sorangium TaxID=39643 RepID=UPI003D9C06FC